MQSPRAARPSSKPQCVASRRPRPGPAPCNSSDPVQTLVTQRAVPATSAIHAISSALSFSILVP
ncbi:MAG: hypothetical protein R2695_05455 [Acidimicrobiales bacterium]